jgi:hypothetical protein
MSLSNSQQAVLRGMGIGMLSTIVLITCGALLNPFGYADPLPLLHRISIAASSGALLAVCLAASIGRLAKHRFLTPEDVDGGGAHSGTARAQRLQAMLQNTLEQSVLAFLVYLVWAIRMPATTLSVLPIAAGAFFLGRILFFAGYEKGAASRALGFALSFYPSVGLLLCIVASEAAGWFQ